jgi:hypothetical protein
MKNILFLFEKERRRLKTGPRPIGKFPALPKNAPSGRKKKTFNKKRG